MSDTVRDVVIRIRTEYAEGKNAPPDMKPLIEAQKDVKEATQGAQHATEKHSESLAEMSRPLSMVIHSTMGLAHSVALLSAANEKDAEQMARKLMVYEGWIMGATGALHLTHALHRAFEMLAKSSEIANAAMKIGAAPVAMLKLIGGTALVAAAAIWALGEHWDAWGNKLARAAEKTKLMIGTLEAARAAAIAFTHSMSEIEFGAVERRAAIRDKTDPKFSGDVMGMPNRFGAAEGAANRLAAAEAEGERLVENEKGIQEKIKDLEGRQRRDRENKKEELRSEFLSAGTSPIGAAWGAIKLGIWGEEEGFTKGFEKQLKTGMAEHDLEATNEKKKLQESLVDNGKQQEANAGRIVQQLTAQRDILRDQVHMHREMVALENDHLRALKEETMDQQQHFGSLNEAQQMALKRIAGLLEADPSGAGLNDVDRRLVGEIGGPWGGALKNQADRNKGIADAGGAEALAKLYTNLTDRPRDGGNIQERTEFHQKALAAAHAKDLIASRQLKQAEDKLTDGGRRAEEIITKLGSTTQVVLHQIIERVTLLEAKIALLRK